MWQTAIAGFESAHPGLRVRAEWLPLSGYSTKLVHLFAAGDAPDVMLIQDEPFPQYAPGQFLDLEQWIAADEPVRERLKDCWPSAVESFRIRGRLHGVPLMGGCTLIYCNERAFERAKVPLPGANWTLDEFVDIACKLTIDEDGDGQIEQFGFFQPSWVYYLPFIWSEGARLMDASRTRWEFTGNAAFRALGLYLDLRHRLGVTPMPVEYAGQNSDMAFLSGRVAMCVNGPWLQPFLAQTALRDRYRVLPIPRGPGGSATRVTWDGVAISARISGERRETAWRFVRHLLGKETQREIARHQRAVPARRALGVEYVRFGGGPDSPARRFIEAVEHGRVAPVTIGWTSLHRAMTRHMTSLLLDGPVRRSPEAVLESLAADGDVRSSLKGVP